MCEGRPLLVRDALKVGIVFAPPRDVFRGALWLVCVNCD